MNRPGWRTATAISSSVLLAASVGVTTAPASGAAPAWQVVASHLNNPRQLTFASSGALYVAEAGTGGSGPCMPGPEEGNVCFGTTGSVTEVTASGQRRVLTGLPSLAAEGTGEQALGASDIVLRGSQKFVLAVGLGADPAVRTKLPAAGQAMGTLVTGKLRHGDWRVMADLAAHEARTNPIDTPDSNPVGLIRRGKRYIVADAGGNTIVRAQRNGRTTTIAQFADVMVDAPESLGMPAGSKIPMQFVPTSVAVGPDHALYISQLTGFPFPVGAAKIWRLVPGHAPTVYASGLTNVTDLAFAPDGSLYAVEIAAKGLLAGPTGALVRIPAGGGSPTVVAGDLFAPYGIALHAGWAYLTVGSVAPGAGQVVRMPLS